MNTEELRTFLVLANTKNFRAASEQLFCSPSTISSRIQSLEHELGEKLFERNSKSVRITDSGSIFYTFASEMMNLWNMSKTSINADDNFHRHLTIGAPASIWGSEMFTGINTLIQESHSTAYHLVVCHSLQTLERLANNTIDFGITLQKPHNPDLESIELKSDNSFFLVASPSVKLPEHFILKPENIRKVPFCFMHQSTTVDFWLEKNYKYSSYFLETDNMPVFIQLLLNGIGIGFLPERSALPYLKTGRLLSYDYMFTDTMPKESVYAVYQKNNYEKIKDLLQVLGIDTANE